MSEDIKTRILNAIEETYFANLRSGNTTSKGSFWAGGSERDEFYISRSLAENNPELIHELINQTGTCWALVQNVIWTGEWNNKPVKNVVVFAKEKESCIEFKNELKINYQIRFQCNELEDQRDEFKQAFINACENQSSENPIERADFEKKIAELKRQIEEVEIQDQKLRIKLLTSNSCLEKFKGFYSIDFE